MKKKKSLFTAKEFQDTFGKRGKRIVKKGEEMQQAEVLQHVKTKYPNVLYTVDLGGVNLTPAQRKIHSTRCKRGHPDMIFSGMVQRYLLWSSN